MLLLLTEQGLALPETDSRSDDIRILIDVSGSMKNNDPHNLRRSALRLVANLIPDDSHAGVWTFGRYVNMLVPLDTVTPRWKQQAMAASEEIASHGLFTDIEATLEDATWDWRREEDPRFRRSLILLTDGLVDTSTDDAEDDRSRSRVIDRILPGLIRGGVTVYTIALSDHADAALLQQLADRSGGWSEVVHDTGQLERVFLRIFEKATQPDTVPLSHDNTFTIDDAISEMTLLVFRKPGSEAARLVTPGGEQLAGDHHPERNVKWHQEQRYDLVTVARPQTGTWRVIADTDPDNRVLVVTDLKLVTTPLPADILSGDSLSLNIMLTQQEQPLAKRDFMNFVEVNVYQSAPDGSNRHWQLLDNGNRSDREAGDGLYSVSLDSSLAQPGRHQVTVHVDGTTFERSRRFEVNVHRAPALANLIPAADTPAARPALVVSPLEALIRPDSMKVSVAVEDAAGNLHTFQPDDNGHREWRVDLDTLPQGGHAATLTVTVDGKRPNGKAVHAQLPLLHTGQKVPVTTASPAAKTTEDSAPGEDHVAGDDTVTEAAGAPAYHWSSIVLQVMLFNALAVMAAFLAWRKWKNTIEPDSQPWDDLEND